MPAFGGVVTYLEYNNLEETQSTHRAVVLEGNPSNVYFFTDLGAYIMNMERAGVLTYIQLGSLFFWGAAGVVVGLFIFFRFVEISLLIHCLFRIIYILEKRSESISTATKKLQKTFVLIVLVQVYTFILFYGFPLTLTYFLISFKIFIIAP